MGTGDLINVREGDGETDLHLLRILHDRAHLAADIAGRFFDPQQNFIV